MTPQLEQELYSDEIVSKKRQIIMDLLTLVITEKPKSVDLFKIYIDNTLDKLDLEVYKPLLAALIQKKEQEAYKSGYAKGGADEILRHAKATDEVLAHLKEKS